MSRRNGTALPWLGWERTLGGAWVLVCRARSREAAWGLLGERVPGAAVETTWAVCPCGAVPRGPRKKGVRR